MPRYIDAEKLEQHFEYCISEAYNTNGVTEDFEIALKATKNQPTADVAPVRHGQWLYSYETISEVKMYICSECRSEIAIDKYDNIEEYNYCQHCGAKMDGGEGE